MPDRTLIKARGWFVVLTLVGLIVLTILLYRPLLVALATPLVASSNNRSSAVAMVAGGDRCYSLIAEQFHAGRHDTVLVFRSTPTRLTDLGILPAGDQLAEQQLVRFAVPERALVKLNSIIDGQVDSLAVLERWLDAHPEQRLAVYCDRFASRRMRWAYDRELVPDTARRVSLVPLPDRRYDESNWWQTKVGIKAFFKQWFLLCYDGVRGEEPPRKAPLSAEEYEAALAHQS